MSEVKRNLHQRIIDVMREVDYIQKEETKINGQYRAVSHNRVVAKIRPSLLKHGLIIVPADVCSVNFRQHEYKTKNGPVSGWRAEMVASYVIYNVDCPAEFIRMVVPSCGFDGIDKDVSKAISSGKKALLLSMFLLETGDEEESQHEYEAPSAEEVEAATPADAAVLAEIANLAKACNVSPDVVASAAHVEKISDIPASKAVEIRDRLKLRHAKLTAQPATETVEAAG